MALFGVDIGVKPELEMFCEWGENDRYLFSRQKINTSEFGAFGIKVGKFKDTKFYKGMKKVGQKIALALPKVIDTVVKLKEPVKKIVETTLPKYKDPINKVIDHVDILKKPAQFISDIVKKRIEEEMKETEKKALESNLPKKDKDEISLNTSEAISALGSITGNSLPEKLWKIITKQAKFIPLIPRNRVSGFEEENFKDITIPVKRLRIMADSPASKRLNGEAIGRLFMSGRKNGALKTKYLVQEITKDKPKMKGLEEMDKAPDFESFFN